MKILKVLLIMAAFMVMLPVSICLLFYTRFSVNIGHFSLVGFSVLVFVAIPGIVGMIAGLCAALSDRTPSVYQVQAEQTFRYGRRSQLEAEMDEMAQLEQQIPIHHPAPIAVQTLPVQPVAHGSAKVAQTIVPEHTQSEIVAKEAEQKAVECVTEEKQSPVLGEVEAINQEVCNHILAAPELNQYSTSEPGEDMSEALASLIKAVSHEESDPGEWRSTVNLDELEKGFDEILANESANQPPHFSTQQENEFFNSVIPFHEYVAIEQQFGEEIANQITTTPVIGAREYHDVMLVKIVNGEIEYEGKTIKIIGSIPTGDCVALVRGQFVGRDTFRIFTWRLMGAEANATNINADEGHVALVN